MPNALREPAGQAGGSELPADSDGWGGLNAMGPRANIAFPRTSAVIAQAGREPQLVNANHVLFYSPYQEYRRAPVDPRGYHCIFLAVSVALLEGVALPAAAAPSDGCSYLVQLLLAEQLRAGAVDRLLVEELLSHLLAAAVAGASSPTDQTTRRQRPRTRRAHAELAEHAKHVLTLRMAEHVSLAELARELYTSPFHLARTFRAHTGFTLHGYRNQLRARRALCELLETQIGLTTLAHRLGYCSLSHFSDSFQAVFGLRPSAVRRLAERPRASEMRRILEAA